jgi:hypothetical protein
MSRALRRAITIALAAGAIAASGAVLSCAWNGTPTVGTASHSTVVASAALDGTNAAPNGCAWD